MGLGGKGNEGVAGQVKQTPGSVGYVELAYANQNNLPVARVRNTAGNFIAPTIASITAAAEGAVPALAAGHRLSHLDRQRTGRRRLSDFVVHVVAGLPDTA